MFPFDYDRDYLQPELEGSTSKDLLNRVVERFIDSNLGLIDDYRNDLDDLKQNARRRLSMKI